MVINLAGSNHFQTGVEFAFQVGETASFISKSVLLKHAPGLMKELLNCPVKFTGISGDALKNIQAVNYQLAKSVVGFYTIILFLLTS